MTTIKCLNDGFVKLIDHMGDDSAICNAARVSYGNDERGYTDTITEVAQSMIGALKVQEVYDSPTIVEVLTTDGSEVTLDADNFWKEVKARQDKDRKLIRYLLNHKHTSPFEMVEFKFIVRVPMDCWRQWIRHRTASVNEYSTRYSEAINSQQTTLPGEWRLQASDNKQGSSGFLTEWSEAFELIEQLSYLDPENPKPTGEYARIETTSKGIKKHFLDSKEVTPGEYLSFLEEQFHNTAKRLYEQRLDLGIAKEQARKDLPLSTYTEAYWKIDLHNLFHFLRLRMDSHAQLEIRTYANAVYELIKPIVPVACEAFEDYVLHAKTFSRMEMELLQGIFRSHGTPLGLFDKPESLTDREWKEFKEKLG